MFIPNLREFSKGNCIMHPPIFLFDLAEKKDSAAPGVRKKRALVWSQVTTYGLNHIRRHPNVGML